jgi:xanthine dehydrogenase accessory factor
MHIYKRIADLLARGETIALATVVRTQGSVPRGEGTKMLIFADGRTEGTIGGGEMESQVIDQGLDVLREGDTKRTVYEFRDPEQGDVGVCGGEMEVFVEPIRPESRLIIIGVGHVGKAIAHLASWLGFRVVVADDRPDFAIMENVPDADAHYTCSIRELPKLIDITKNDYLVLTTRGVTLDVEGLPGLLKTEAAYIGVIGSKRRWETTVEALIESGVEPGALDRIQSPIGLEIHAETPEEIAVSVIAEIIMQRRGGSGEPMAYKPRTSKKEER